MPTTRIARAAAEAASEISERVPRFLRIPEPRTGFRILNPGSALRAIHQGRITPFRSEQGAIQFLRSAYMPDNNDIVATYTSHNLQQQESSPMRYVLREPIPINDPSLRVSFRDSSGDHVNVPITDDLIRRAQEELPAKQGNNTTSSGEIVVSRSMPQREVHEALSNRSEPIYMHTGNIGLFPFSNNVVVRTPVSPTDMSFGGIRITPETVLDNPETTVLYNLPNGSRYEGPIRQADIEGFQRKRDQSSPEERLWRDLFEQEQNNPQVPAEETVDTNETEILRDYWRRVRDDSAFRRRGAPGILTDAQKAEYVSKIREYNLANPTNPISPVYIPGFAAGSLTPRWDDEAKWFSRFGSDGKEYRSRKFSPREVYDTVDDFIQNVPSGGVVGPSQSVSTDAYPMLLTSAIKHSGSTPGKIKTYPLSTTTRTNLFGDTGVYFDDVFTEELETRYPFLLEVKDWIKQNKADNSIPGLSRELKMQLNDVIMPIYNKKAQNLINIYKRKYQKLGESNPDILINTDKFEIANPWNPVGDMINTGKVPVQIEYPELLFDKLKKGGQINPYK